jgi:competence protein ComFB
MEGSKMEKFEDKFKYLEGELSNNTEKLVVETMEELLVKSKYENVCTCKECLLDIASYALNRLPAKYIFSPKRDLFTQIVKFENKVNMDVKSTVKKAIRVIDKNPRHDRNE